MKDKNTDLKDLTPGSSDMILGDQSLDKRIEREEKSKYTRPERLSWKGSHYETEQGRSIKLKDLHPVAEPIPLHFDIGFEELDSEEQQELIDSSLSNKIDVMIQNDPGKYTILKLAHYYTQTRPVYVSNGVDILIHPVMSFNLPPKT